MIKNKTIISFFPIIIFVGFSICIVTLSSFLSRFIGDKGNSIMDESSHKELVPNNSPSKIVFLYTYKDSNEALYKAAFMDGEGNVRCYAFSEESDLYESKLLASVDGKQDQEVVSKVNAEDVDHYLQMLQKVSREQEVTYQEVYVDVLYPSIRRYGVLANADGSRQLIELGGKEYYEGTSKDPNAVKINEWLKKAMDFEEEWDPRNEPKPENSGCGL